MPTKTLDATAGHTPVPWIVDRTERGHYFIMTTGELTIAQVFDAPEYSEVEANAALIVLAVNHHLALVATLRAILPFASHGAARLWKHPGAEADAMTATKMVDDAIAVLHALDEETQK